MGSVMPHSRSRPRELGDGLEKAYMSITPCPTRLSRGDLKKTYRARTAECLDLGRRKHRCRHRLRSCVGHCCDRCCWRRCLCCRCSLQGVRLRCPRLFCIPSDLPIAYNGVQDVGVGAAAWQAKRICRHLLALHDSGSVWEKAYMSSSPWQPS
jgi:hypothetical protein